MELTMFRDHSPTCSHAFRPRATVSGSHPRQRDEGFPRYEETRRLVYILMFNEVETVDVGDSAAGGRIL